MDGVKLAAHLYKNIRQRKEQLSESLADGAIGSMEDYRAITGEIRGLVWIEEELRTSMKGIEDDLKVICARTDFGTEKSKSDTKSYI